MKKILNNILISKSIFAFDFDGVVVNSMYLKGKIFAKIFNVNNYNKKKIITYHLLNGSMKRRKKIQYIAENILKLKMSNSTRRIFMINKENEFKRIYSDQLSQIKLVKGIKNYFKLIKKNKGDIYIVSSAPIREINLICKLNLLNSYITKIYDTKISKIEALKKIHKMKNISKKNIIYFGDSLSDLKVSNFLKIDFCALLTNSKSGLNIKKNLLKINDFR